jgi:hypothetical protein
MLSYAICYLATNEALETDLTLLKVAEDTLRKAGWPTDILTGRFMFGVGDNERFSIPSQNYLKL